MRLRFHMSEGQAAAYPDWEGRTFEVESRGDVQLVYGNLVDEKGDLATYDARAGMWIAPDGHPYSDIAISA